MNQFWLKVFLAGMILTHCGSAHAGWFDGQKKKAAQAQPAASAQVQQVKAAAPAAAAAVAAAAAPVRQAVSAPAVNQGGKSQFLDVGTTGVKSELEIARENQEKESARVRLSDEETKKMKAEMEKLRQGIKSAQDAKQAVLAARAEAKPVSIPAIPKLPEIASVRPAAVPARPARPESLKKVSAPAAVSGYKQ